MSTTEAPAVAADAQTMPLIDFGPARISRLIAGSNTINGGSHLSTFVNQQMRRFFTPERIQWFLQRCQECGVNTLQAGGGCIEWVHEHNSRGGDMRYLSLASENPEDPWQIERIAEAGAIGIAHHGEVTDVMLKEGRLHEAREFCKRIRDTGVQVGVSTHMPRAIEVIEEEAWDIDFYMACVYERHRSREELLELLGHVPVPVREVYLESDPPRMYEAIRSTSKPCLAFKILAAGRVCDSPDGVEAAFRQSFEGIKPTDAVIVGMYPEYSDQVAENAALTATSGR